MRPLGWAAACALAVGGLGCGDGGSEAPATVAPVGSTFPGAVGSPTVGVPTVLVPTVLSIVSPATGDQVAGNVVRLDVTTSGIGIVEADGDTSGRTGHYHVFVDRDEVAVGEPIPFEPGIIHSADDPIVVPGLSVGHHRVTVVHGDGTHRRIGGAAASTSFVVLGPSVTADAPAVVAAGDELEVTATVEGLEVPDEARLHLLVDQDPPRPGEALPRGGDARVLQGASIVLADLAPGDHVLWVVAASADRVPLDPPVMDRLEVVVRP